MAKNICIFVNQFNISTGTLQRGYFPLDVETQWPFTTHLIPPPPKVHVLHDLKYSGTLHAVSLVWPQNDGPTGGVVSENRTIYESS